MPLDEIDETISDARADAAESHKAAMNSYGAGYDAGFLAGLLRAKEILESASENNFQARIS